MLKRKTTNTSPFPSQRENAKIFSFTHTFFSKSSIRTKLFVGIGLLLIIIPTFFYCNEYVQLAFFTPHVPIIVEKNFSIPTTLTIPAVDIQLPIDETVISHNVWQIADSGASHLAISARPGENGPIIIYGHNTNDRLGPIRWLRTGENITLMTQDGKMHVYKITKTLDTTPSQTSLFFSEKGETLFLYTCDGFADLQRFIVIAHPA